MAPILGIYASQISGHLFGPTGAYDSIASTTLGSNSSSVTLSSIPSTYTHLQLRIFTGSTSVPSTIRMQFNSDTAANYSSHYLIGNGSVAESASQTSASWILAQDYTGGGLTTSPGVLVIDILDYANTNKNKTTRQLVGYDANGSGIVGLGSGNWRSTSAITSITLSQASASLLSGSIFALYGIKGN
jgi:hypothetical protein